MKVLMVCLGNICRSPLAQGILESKKPHWIIDSAGTAEYHIGKSPDKRSIQIGALHKTPIENQKARVFRPQDLETFDYILAMDRDNLQQIRAHIHLSNHYKKTHCITDFINDDAITEIPDPYYGTIQDFEYVHQLLNEACNGFIEFIDAQ